MRPNEGCIGRGPRLFAVSLLTLALVSLSACERELADGGVEITQGTTAIPIPSALAAPSHAFVAFASPAAGEVSVSIDWEPRPNRLSFVVAEGACSTSPCPTEVNMGGYTDGANNRPISGSGTLSAGLYTLRIDNWGPDLATASYRVRLAPR
jgi:hypothetical protein